MNKTKFYEWLHLHILLVDPPAQTSGCLQGPTTVYTKNYFILISLVKYSKFVQGNRHSLNFNRKTYSLKNQLRPEAVIHATDTAPPPPQGERIRNSAKEKVGYGLYKKHFINK